ncbi:hypothetical protein BN946_scf184999.g57 [Trametes cinnabarina]|uniref:Uncharacterized protein n=1 Tax=Pycnoporus cinnabarinus TaxID=5643 RepID=A0A060S861_PYCCI|nr:hypothetical protein BN946_scf184999.g57 [Trametes cinnabarina]
MPGPRNKNKKNKNAKLSKDKREQQQQSQRSSWSSSSSPTPAPSTPSPFPTSVQHVQLSGGEPKLALYAQSEQSMLPEKLEQSPPAEFIDEPPIPSSLLQTPFIYDPGDGPRVKDPRAFMASRLAAPPTLNDELCAEFAEEAVLQMLCTVLPEETALILWYNKSRQTARICPACQRLYRLGDVLPDHLAGETREQQSETRASPYLAREQELSGLCSPICFILASYNYPGAIRSTWGRMAEELDDATWDLLGAPHTPQPVQDLGLGMLLKMTRCHDLGLGQLFFPNLDLEAEKSDGESSEETVRETAGAVLTKKSSVKPANATANDVDIMRQMQELQVGGNIHGKPST